MRVGCSQVEVCRHDCAFKTRRKRAVELPVERHKRLLRVKRAFAVVTGRKQQKEEKKKLS